MPILQFGASGVRLELGFWEPFDRGCTAFHLPTKSPRAVHKAAPDTDFVGAPVKARVILGNGGLVLLAGLLLGNSPIVPSQLHKLGRGWCHVGGFRK